MFFQQLRTGDYFRIAGVSSNSVYRKASSSYCHINGFLQRIKPYVLVTRLTFNEIEAYRAQQQSELDNTETDSK
ncbi:hypothetical protein H6G76_32950 [Nostoc sp. FACHB-152]|uniref:hypothetical protein n=1 Tax=Nostoc sp. FACHB-152 TaxID=2692837 RepID=UPI0016841071|nr:hypothetical protein [Nostoc sp. FACHB-152]MBD2451846.1 hypothetical protein [Nostoc sp. FACHB-152]